MATAMSPEFARLAAETDPDIAQAAWENAQSGQLMLLLLSGWIASGKDSVAPAVADALGVTDPEHVYFAIPLKGEVDRLLELITAQTGSNPDPATEMIAEAFDVPRYQAAIAVGALWAATRNPAHGLTARTRTPEMRFVLQYWGTEVRRAQDPDYWVKRALPSALAAMAAGRSVYGTDARYLNEVTGARAVGFTVVRLDITREEQRRRLMSRDGIEPDPASLFHPSETALDDWDGFDLRVDNNGPIGSTVDAICAHLGRGGEVLAS